MTTIVAPATPAGSSAVGIIRMSGPESLNIVAALTKAALPPPRTFGLRFIYDPQSGALIDQAGLLVFNGPNSSTGENVAEIHHHGSTAISGLILSIILNFPNCRKAEPGEFSKTAFLNKKLTFSQIASLPALIEARTEQQVLAAAQLFGSDSNQSLERWAANLFDCRIPVEAVIDFSDQEDVGAEDLQQIKASLESVVEEMKLAIATASRASKVANGFHVVLSGQPNVGKSSLLNAFAGSSRSIVSDLPGTTRDLVQVDLNLEGQLVSFIDTAGIRESSNEIEREGIDRARKAAEEADLVIHVVEYASNLTTKSQIQIVVVNKSDLLSEKDQVKLREDSDLYLVSAKTGQGLPALLKEIHDRLVNSQDRAGEQFLVQHFMLNELESLSQEIMELIEQLPVLSLDLIGEQLRYLENAFKLLAHSGGTKDVLDQIFSRYCIGK